MIKTGFIINVSNNSVERNCSYDDERIDGMYYKVDGKDLIPVAYVFPEKSREPVEFLLKELKEAKKIYDDMVARIYYKEFPQYR